MAYVNPLDPTTPLGSDAVSAGDDMFRSVKAALIERMDSFFTGHDIQPWQAKSGSGAATQWIVSDAAQPSVRLAYTGSGSRNIDLYADSTTAGMRDATAGAAVFKYTYTGAVVDVGSNIGSTGQVRLNAGVGTTIIFTIGGSTVATQSSTGLAAFQFTGINSGAVYITNIATTAAIYGSVTNTGGSAIWSVESSAGGGAFPNTAVYAAAFGTNAARPVQLVSNGRVEMTIASGGAITVPNGTVTISTGGLVIAAAGANITGGVAISTGAADAFSTTVNGGVLNANFLQSGAFDLVVRMTSAGHFWDLRKLNADGSFSFGYDGAEKGRITNGGVFAWGTAVTTGAGAGNIVLSNGTAYASVNGAGTAALGMLDMDASNRTRLQLNNAALAFNNPSTAASATAGGATALPANPTGYLITTMNGTTAKIPYYNN